MGFDWFQRQLIAVVCLTEGAVRIPTVSLSSEDFNTTAMAEFGDYIRKGIKLSSLAIPATPFCCSKQVRERTDGSWVGWSCTSRLGVALGSLVWWLAILHIAGDWNEVIIVVLFSPGHSVMLWFYELLISTSVSFSTAHPSGHSSQSLCHYTELLWPKCSTQYLSNAIHLDLIFRFTLSSSLYKAFPPLSRSTLPHNVVSSAN